MLVCPHCQFENPDAHKFCQSCGASLIDKDCPACRVPVSFDTEHCPQCGTTTGTIWRAILVSAGNSGQIEQRIASHKQGEQMLPDCASEFSIAVGIAPFPALGKYLDAQQRYQFLEPLPETTQVAKEREIRVLDCQPFQPAQLEALYLQSAEISDVGQIAAVPAIAKPYLELQDRYPSLPLPNIHDAWKQEGLDVLLLEDRTELPSLLDLWQDENIMPLQILHWLREMIEFWTVLSQQHCCQSLLKLDNLRVDEDYLLCLQRLYLDQPEHPPALRELGVIWQTLFQQSQRTQNGDLAKLCLDLEVGDVNSPEQLRSRIEAIAASLQPDPRLMVMTSQSSEPSNLASLTSLNNSGLEPKPFEAKPFAPPDQESAEVTPITQIEKPSNPEDPRNPEELNNPFDPKHLNFEEGDEGMVSEGDDQPTVVLPMRLISLEDAGRTDIGRQRDHNEDCFSIQTESRKIESPQERALKAKGLYILCDGMGGHAGGEVASALAVETLRQYFEANWHNQLPSEESIREAIQQANRAIYDRNQENARSGSGRMGTTLVLVLVQGTEAAIAHVGDSRLYRFSRRRGLEQVTVDHEVGQREIQRGVEPAIAYARPDAYQLTQALGPRDENFINPEVKFLELNEDMLLLLCSDGLTDNDLLETHWRTHLEPLLKSQANLEQGVSELIELANHYNGHDNITAIAIRAGVRPDLDLLHRK